MWFSTAFWTPLFHTKLAFKHTVFFFSVYCYFSFEAFRIFSCLAFNNSTMVYLGINVLVFILSRLNWAGWIHMSMLFLGAFFSHYFFKYLYVLFSLFFFCDFHYIYITILNQVLFLRDSEAVCVCVCDIYIFVFVVVCFSGWIISIDLSLDSLIFSLCYHECAIEFLYKIFHFSSTFLL